MIKLIVFDFDGVIISSHDLQKEALHKVYEKLGRSGEPPYETFFSHSGDSLQNIFQAMDIPVDMVQIYQEYSLKNMNLVKLQPGIINALKKLKVDGYFIALCTGKESKRTHILLEHFNIASYFKWVICSDNIIKPKPDPESLITIMSMAKIKSEKTLMVGDGINDIKCAKAAGVKSIAVTWGDCKPENLLLERPDYIVDSIEELIKTVHEQKDI